ncbi:MAG: anthranilate phosphoribosyltransferase [Bacteroidota bacterium]
MKAILSKLYEHQHLSREEAREVLMNISNETYPPAQVASFMTVYLMRAITVDELQGFREALLELCLTIDLEGRETIDIVGTGGDGKNTFNISTLSSFLVAGAGYKVTKHGNRGVSSVSGSSNVLQQMGYLFTDNRDKLMRQLDKAGICFFHAPLFHPAMKAVAPIRRALKLKTFFNMLGPLVNPAQPKYQLFGVYSLELARLYQYILQQSKKQFSVVYAMDGYDEVSLTSPFKVRTHHSEQLITPTDIGKSYYQQQDLYGGETIAEAATIFQNILKGNGTAAQNDVVATNAGLAIHCIHPEKSLLDCIAEAQESLESGRALKALETLVALA